MIKIKYEFPVKHFDGNICYGKNYAWAYYSFTAYSFAYLSDNQKLAIMQDFAAFVCDAVGDVHLLVIPRKRKMSEVTEKFVTTIKGDLKDVGIRHARQTTKVLEKKFGDSTEYEYYIGVKLDKNHSAGIFDSVKSAWTDFKRELYDTADMGFCLYEDDEAAYKSSEDLCLSRMLNNIDVRPTTKQETQFLIERNFNRRGQEELLLNYDPYYSEEQDYKEFEGSNIMRITENIVDNSDMRSLVLREEDGDSYISFLPVSKINAVMDAPGRSDYVYRINALRFPVELSMRIEKIKNDKSQKMVSDQSRTVNEEAKYVSSAGEAVGRNIKKAQQGLHSLSAKLEDDEGMSLVKTSIVFAVVADNEQQLNERVNTLRSVYRKNYNMVLQRPRGDQFLLFNEYFPCGKIAIRDYVHIQDANTVAAGFFGATRDLGDPTGFFIGTTGLLNRQVYLDPSLAAQNVKNSITSSLSISVTGNTGAGKSVFVNLMCYLIALSGGKILILDPKGERGHWKKELKEISEHINIVTLTTDMKYKGLLDPFTLLEGKEAEELAISVLCNLSGVKNTTDPDSFAEIVEAVEFVGSQDKACLLKVVDKLREQESAQRIAKIIKSFTKQGLSILLFGDGEKRDTVQLESAINILQIQHLQLPDRDVLPSEYSLSEVLSIAMMLPISAFAKKFIMQDRSILKIAILEECWAIIENQQGKTMSNIILREGRRMNAGEIFVTQNTSDINYSEFRNNIGLKFAFRAEDEDEIREILKYFDLPDSKGNIKLIKSLKSGQCLFKDLYGRIGVLKVNCVFRDLFNVFDTRPPVKEGGE